MKTIGENKETPLTNKLVLQFIKSVEASKYGKELSLYYEYYDFMMEDMHIVSHTNRYLEYEDEEFKSFIGGLLKEMIVGGMYNFCFRYDYQLDRQEKGD